MRLILITLLALLVATVVGLGATWMTATRGTDLGTLTIGAWTARPKTGTADIDPYSRATITRNGELPIGTGDGVAFVARTDDRKKLLDGRCDVVVSGVTPAARFWTLALYDSKGRLVANALQRYGFTSQELVRGADILVQIEKMLDEAAKTATKTSSEEPPKPGRPVSSSALPYPDSFAAATTGEAAKSPPRKN